MAPLPPSRRRSSLSYSSEEQSQKPDLDGWAGQRRPACSDGGYVGRQRWDPRCGAALAAAAPPASPAPASQVDGADEAANDPILCLPKRTVGKRRN